MTTQALELKACLPEFYTWEISPPSPHGSHCFLFIRHSHRTIVNLNLNYTPILLSPACEFTPKSCDLGGGVGEGRGLFFFPFSRASHSFSRDKVDGVWGRDTDPPTVKVLTLFSEEVVVSTHSSSEMRES